MDPPSTPATPPASGGGASADPVTPPASGSGTTTDPTTPPTGDSGGTSDPVAPPTAGTGTPDTTPPATPEPPPAVVKGTATLQWNVPTEFTDGSVLPSTELAGFGIYHGDSAGNLTRVAEVDHLATTLTIKDLEAGTHYFAVAAISMTGEAGELSEVLSKSVL